MTAPGEPEPTTTMVELVLPADTNHHGTLFGGAALAMMDKAGFVAATRHSRATLVTVASERVDFRAPVHEGEIADLTARVVATGRTSITTEVEIHGEELLTGRRRLAAVAQFVYVAVDDEGRPTAVPQIGEGPAATT